MTSFIKNKSLLTIIVAIAVFVGFVYFNYLKAQRDIRDTKPAPLSVDLISYPEKIKPGSSAAFIWRVNSSPDLSTTYTTIYWSYDSSPSALTKSDSPDAVRYPHSQVDYASGNFRLPDTFDVNVLFTKPGRIFFRAYAKVKDDHLWSEEKFFDIDN